MHPGLFRISIKALRYYRKQVIYQFLIIMLLCAVITGALMTGSSVRTSLKNTALENIGNTRFIISSGLRYFDRKLTGKMVRETGLSCTGILQLRGSSQALSSQKILNNVFIYAVTDDFFRFHNCDYVNINPGEIIVNERLALSLGITEGDDIILRFSDVSDIPSDAPFAPSGEENTSIVLKTGRIISPAEMGNFSLAISQVPAANIFINLADLEKLNNKKYKINRILVAGKSETSDIRMALKKIIDPQDVGIHIRRTKTGSYEIISDRVFFDEILIDDIRDKIREASPLITYLANTIYSGDRMNPYSFISALPEDIYPETPRHKEIVINKWLAEDLKAGEGDSLKITWFSPDSLNHLVERSTYFAVREVKEMKGIWGDSLLMPDFPGISRSESCSEWDAGIPVKTNIIRDQDEDYWDRYKGTPKAFINYSMGKELWGSNYGPATAIRFPAGITYDHIYDRLAGLIDPSKLGFTVNDIYYDSIRAADNSVDFGTLFLSLGFFLILASMVLLSFSLSFYFDIKLKEIRVLYSLGFRSSYIRNILLLETSAIALIACIAGGFLGYMVNRALITALNTVWSGAVQTNALLPSFDILSLSTGVVISFAICVVFMAFRIKGYLNNLNKGGTKHYVLPDKKKNIILLIAGIIATLLASVTAIMSPDSISISFFAGSLLLITMIFFWRQLWMSGKYGQSLSASYYSFHPSHAVTPVLFIAAGVFAIFITAVNRKDLNKNAYESSSGTGGYLFWMESSLPVIEEMNSVSGRLRLGLDEESLSGLKFVQMKRSPGNDASCLNLNHITAPPLIGADINFFKEDKAFSFTKTITNKSSENPWNLIEDNISQSVIYGLADQTVLDWGLKIGVGDTLILRAENGQPLKIVIAAGLQSSVFQGYVIISKANFSKYYPSVSGNSVFLVKGNKDQSEMYRDVLAERLSSYGLTVEYTSDRLGKFYEITNTYLTVFGVFGGLGMITGIAGLGFVVLRNYNRRKREFALMLSAGFSPKKLRKMIFSEQVNILLAGLITGTLPALLATLPSLRSNHEIPWLYLILVVSMIFITGMIAAILPLRSINESNLITALRKD